MQTKAQQKTSAKLYGGALGHVSLRSAEVSVVVLL